MNLMVRDPFLAEPFRLMDEVFGRVLGNGNRVTGWVPPLDVHETEEEYVVYLDVPGVKREDVTIELNDRVLSIAGTRVPRETGDARRSERPYGSFARNLTLPHGVDGDSVVADYAEGVLTLRIPKPADVKPKRIAIGGSDQKALAQ